MDNPIQAFAQLPTAGKVAVSILLVVQLTLAVIALIRLARHEQARIAGLPRAAWVVVIVLG